MGNLPMRVLASIVVVVSSIVACGGTVATTPVTESSCIGLSADVCGKTAYCAVTTDFQDGQNHYRDGCFRKCETDSPQAKVCGSSEQCTILRWIPRTGVQIDVYITESVCLAKP
jgi:hypothetical protein